MTISLFAASIVSLRFALVASTPPFTTTFNTERTYHGILNVRGLNFMARAVFEFAILNANGDRNQVGRTVSPLDDYPGVLT